MKANFHVHRKRIAFVFLNLKSIFLKIFLFMAKYSELKSHSVDSSTDHSQSSCFGVFYLTGSQKW